MTADPSALRTPGTGTGRIRWEPTEPGSDDSFGYVGTLDRAMFTLWAPRRDDEAWEASSTLLPHQPGERYVGADADEAKGEAERWLEEFISSDTDGEVAPILEGESIAFADAASELREAITDKLTGEGCGDGR